MLEEGEKYKPHAITAWQLLCGASWKSRLCRWESDSHTVFEPSAELTLWIHWLSWSSISTLQPPLVKGRCEATSVSPPQGTSSRDEKTSCTPANNTPFKHNVVRSNCLACWEKNTPPSAHHFYCRAKALQTNTWIKHSHHGDVLLLKLECLNSLL